MLNLLRSHPWYLGVSCQFAWVFTATQLLRVHAGLVYCASFYLAISVCLIAILVISLHVRLSERILRAGDFVGCLTLFGSSLMILSFEWTGLTPLAINPAVMAILGGLGSAWSYVRWLAPYRSLPARQSIALAVCAVIIAAVLKLALSALGSVVTGVGLLLLSLAVFATLVKAQEKSKSKLQVQNETSSFLNQAVTARPLWKLGFAVAIYSFAVGVSWAVLLDNPTTYPLASLFVLFLLEVALCALYFVIQARFSKRFSFTAVWRVAVLLISAAILIAPQVTGFAYDAIVAFVSATQTLIAVLWFLALADVARRGRLNSMHTVCMGWIFYSFPLAAGMVFGMALATINPLQTVLPALTVLALVAVAFVVDDRSLPRGPLFQEITGAHGFEENPLTAPTPYSTVSHEDSTTPAETADDEELNRDDGLGQGRKDKLTVHCVAMARYYDLTNREFDVLVELAHGRSGVHIAETLTLSENTVKGHTKRLYAKLGVHSRQELIDMAENFDVSRSY